jgi:hypothetical protein
MFKYLFQYGKSDITPVSKNELLLNIMFLETMQKRLHGFLPTMSLGRHYRTERKKPPPPFPNTSSSLSQLGPCMRKRITANQGGLYSDSGLATKPQKRNNTSNSNVGIVELYKGLGLRGN